MLLKVLRESFTSHAGKKYHKNDTFIIDEKNYNLKPFYKRRMEDGDVKEVIEKKEIQKKSIINKSEEK